MTYKPTKITLPSKIMDFGDSHPDEVSVKGVVVTGYDPITDLWLALKWSDPSKFWLVGGGKNSDEDYFETAIRELREETGYIFSREAYQLGAPIKSHYFNDKKKSYRNSFAYSYLFIIDSTRSGHKDLEPHEDFENAWLSLDKLKEEIEKIKGSEHWLEIIARSEKVISENYLKST